MIEKKEIQGRFGSNPCQYIAAERERWENVKTNYVSIRREAYEEYGILRAKEIKKPAKKTYLSTTNTLNNEHNERGLQAAFDKHREQRRKEKIRSYYQKKNQQIKSGL